MRKELEPKVRRDLFKIKQRRKRQKITKKGNGLKCELKTDSCPAKKVEKDRKKLLS